MNEMEKLDEKISLVKIIRDWIFCHTRKVEKWKTF